MNTQLRPKHRLRAGSIWAAVFFTLVLSGTIVTYGMNDEAALEGGKVEAAQPPTRHSSLTSGETKKFRIVIDPGHGGIDPGAEGTSGIQEKDYALSVAQKLYDLLKKDPSLDPHLTRTDDTFVDLVDRAKFANDLQADAFLSIHANFFRDSAVGGTESFYYSDDSWRLAETVQRNVVNAMGFQDREIKKRKLRVLARSEMPAVLLEVGYLTNEREEASMTSVDGQTHTAEAIAAGLKQYIADTEKR